MTNAQMGISCFERNGILASNNLWTHSFSCVFSTFPRPSFGLALNVKQERHIGVVNLNVSKSLKCKQVCSLSKGESSNCSTGGGILEKEFEFKPSFDEYLKALESVRTGSEKRQSCNSNGYKSKRGVRGKYKENVKLGKFDGKSHRVKNYEVEKKGCSEHTNEVTSQGDMVTIKFDFKEGGGGELKDARKNDLGEVSSKRVYTGSIGLEDKARNMDVKEKIKLGRQGTEGRQSKYQTCYPKDQLSKYQIHNVVPPLKGSMLAKSTKNWSEQESIWQVDAAEVIGKHTGLGGELGYDKDHVQVKKVTDTKIELRNGNAKRNKKDVVKKGDDDDQKMERAAFKNFEIFNDIMDKPRVSRIEMEERIQKLAKWLNGADINMPEWMFSKMMRSAKVRFADYSIVRVIQILGKLGNWRRVLHVIEWLQVCERFKSHKGRYIYTTALDVLGKARRPVEALNLFYAMQQQMSLYPDLVAYHCIAVTLGQAGHMKELFDVIDIMRSPPKKKFKTGVHEKWDPRLEPDIVVYNAVLNACVRRKQWEGAFWVLQQLKQQGQQPSSTTYGLVMEVMFACDKYNLVHEFFRKMQKSSIPNALTYKVLVNTLWQEGKIDEAVLVVQDMERRGIVGSAALYYDLARCLCSAGRCQEALLQVKKICRVASKPLVVTYTGLIQACLESGNVQNGMYIFNHMRELCEPNLVTCNLMIKAYEEHRMFKEAKELFQEMSQDGNHVCSKSDNKDRTIPDIYTFNTMLNACIAERSWDDFECVYKQMLHQGHHFNARRHLQMILETSRAGKGELLETTWKHLSEANRIPPPSLIKERFCMKLEKNDYSTAISCVTNLPRSDSPAFSKTAWSNLFKENAHRFQTDTLAGLIDELNILIFRDDPPHPILQNLITSCKEIFRTRLKTSKMNKTVMPLHIDQLNMKQP